MKKIFLLCLTLLFGFSLVGCEDEPNNDNPTTDMNNEVIVDEKDNQTVDESNEITVDEKDKANQTKDIEERTYMGVVYDKGYYIKMKDGLRSRVEISCMFNISDHKFFRQLHGTAGSGRTFNYEGTWEGSLNDRVIVSYEKGDEMVSEEYTFSGKHMYDEDDEYDEKEIQLIIRNLR